MDAIDFRVEDLPVEDHDVTSGHPLNREKRWVLDMQAGGRAWIDDLIQCRTYAGVLLGVPDDPVDAIVRAMRSVKHHFNFYDGPACVLPPRLHKGLRRVVNDGVEEFHAWRLLPSITSYALLTSTDLARDEDHSSVVVIWFQDAFGLPDDAVIAQMRAIDWRRYAVDWGW
ncbi:MAG: hypothetical protein JNM79_01625 [Burkholderiales bacterium]|nr:hypothetical protein [Burkholderiales bacterium]